MLLLLHACDDDAAVRCVCIPGRTDPGCYAVAHVSQPMRPLPGTTLVTQVTRSKLRYLEWGLRTWGGPVSVALYAYDAQEVAFFSSYACRGCTVSVVHGGSKQQAYPINLLRNVALQAAATDLVFVFDTDFLPSPELHDQLVRRLAAAPAQNRTAFVVPAFQFLRNFSAPASFRALKAAFLGGDVRVFHGTSGGHQYTQVDVWLQTRTPYCLFCSGPRFKPYVVVNKTEPGFPLFDEQYMDRGMNKVCVRVWQL